MMGRVQALQYKKGGRKCFSHASGEGGGGAYTDLM